MKKTSRSLTRIALALIVVSGGLFFCSDASAEYCGACVNATNNQAEQTRNTITSKISESTDTIVSTIQNAIGGATNMITKNASAIANQDGADREAIAKAQTQDAAASSAAASVGNTPCGVTSGASGGSGGGSPGPGGNPNTKYDPSNMAPRLKDAMNRSGATSSPTLPSPIAAVQKSDLGVGSCQMFAGTNTVRAKMCSQAGIAPVDANPYVNADIEATTLFDGPQKPGDDTPMMSVPVSGQARDARHAYMSMLSDPIPPATPNIAASQSPAYKAYLGQWAHYEAVMSLAQAPIDDWDRWTTVDPQTVNALNVMSQDPAAATFLNTYFKNHPNSSMAAGVSQQELMNIEVERRVGNPDWVKEMAGAEEPTRQSEALMMQAYQMRIEFEQLVATRRTNVLLGEILAATAHGSLRQALDADVQKVNASSLQLTSQAAGGTASTSSTLP